MNKDDLMPTPSLITLIVACALFMENFDSTVIATSLPPIAADLHESPLALKLALTAYTLSLAVFIPLSGWAADRVGSREIFRAAIAVFTIGSVLCGLSTGLTSLVLARLFQGLGGAMMVPVGRLILYRTVPKTELVQSLALLTTLAILGPVCGPPVGGFLTTYLNWRWIFWINVPLGLIGYVLATIFIPNVLQHKVWPFDFIGFLLSGLGLSCLTTAITLAGDGTVSPWLCFVLLASGLATGAIFLRHAQRIAYPLLDVGLLRLPTFRSSLLGGSFFRVGIGALTLLLPLLLQVGLAMNSFGAGCLILASAAGALGVGTIAKPMLSMFGFRYVLAASAVLNSLFLIVYGQFSQSTSALIIFVTLLIGGLFRAVGFTAIGAIAIADVDDEAMGRATSFLSVAQQFSISVGIALGALALESTRMFYGDTVIAFRDFAPALYIVAAISFGAFMFFIFMPAEAGGAISGHVRTRQS